METIETADAIEALEDFGYECRRENDRLIVDRDGMTVAILAEPVLLEMVDQLLENLGL
jgi:hypothetical protein